MYNSKNTSSLKVNQEEDKRFLGFRYHDKHNQDAETRLNESMYNSKNTSSLKVNQEEDKRFLGFRYHDKHNQDAETRLNESMHNSKTRKIRKFIHKRNVTHCPFSSGIRMV